MPVGEIEQNRSPYLNGVSLQAVGLVYHLALESEDFESTDDTAQQTRDRIQVYCYPCWAVIRLETVVPLSLEHCRGLENLSSCESSVLDVNWTVPRLLAVEVLFGSGKGNFGYSVAVVGHGNYSHYRQMRSDYLGSAGDAHSGLRYFA